MKYVNTMDEAIEAAKTTVAKWRFKTFDGKRYGPDHIAAYKDKRWVSSGPARSYGDEHYDVEVMAWEGSPPKGYIIVNYATKMVIAMGDNMNVLNKFVADPFSTKL